MSTDRKISTLINTQLPDFVVSDYPHIQTFLEAYYEWMEQTGEPIELSKNLLSLQDIDTTRFGSITLMLGAGSGSYIINETVFQGPTLAQAVAKGVVVNYDSTTGELEVKNIIGQFSLDFGNVQGSTSSAAYSLTSIDAIKSTVDNFVSWFRKEFIPSIPQEIISDPKLLIKNIKDFYRAKGTEKSYKLLFNIMFGENVSFYYPARDMLRPDDGKWIQHRTLRVLSMNGDPFKLIGQKIRGENSLASAYVENVQLVQVDTYTIYELYLNLSSISGNFEPNEMVKNSDSSIISQISPVITGIMLIDGGENYTVGDIISITGGGGSGAAAEVKSVDLNGKVLSAQITNFGAGYTSLPTVTFPPTISTAIGFAVLGSLTEYPGYFLNEDGKIDSTKYLQDDYYYQQFSYVLRSSQTIQSYADIVKRLVHPAGLIFFGELQAISEVDGGSVAARNRFGNTCSYIRLETQYFLPQPYGTQKTYPWFIDPNQDQPLVLNGKSDIADSIFTNIANIQKASNAYGLGPTYRSLERDKFKYKPYEAHDASVEMGGNNTGYWAAYGNTQLKDFVDVKIGDVTHTPWTSINVLPDPFLESKIE